MAISTYNYSKLIENSMKMTTLPLPKNDSGSDAYERAIDILEGIDKDSLIYSNNVQQVIHQAIKSLRSNRNISSTEEQVKDNSLLSLLYFLSNDYKSAKRFSELAIKSTPSSVTLPSFIYATSSLYEADFNFTSITDNYFSYSIRKEPENQLIPLLFSIYLDRMFLRISSDEFLGVKSLNHIFDIMKSPLIENHRALNYNVLLPRYVTLLKLRQQKIASLSNSLNETIKNNPKTLSIVINSLEEYDVLIKDSTDIMNHILALDMDDEARTQASNDRGLLASYIQDKERLSAIVNDLKIYQNNLPKNEMVTTKNEMATTNDVSSDNPYMMLFIVSLIIISGYILVNHWKITIITIGMIGVIVVIF